MAWQVFFSNAANFISADIFITAQAPAYPTAVITAITFSCLGFFFVLFCYFFLIYKNKEKERRRLEMTECEREADDEINFKFAL